MSTNYIIRPAVPEQDFTALAELLTAVGPQPITAVSLFEWEANNPPGQIRRRWVVEAPDGRLVGYGVALHPAHAADGRFQLWLCVHPAHRQQGLGAQLYETVWSFAREQGATLLTSDVREECPACLRFAEKRGFAIEHHLFESVIDLHTFDERPFAGVIAEVEAGGIRLTSLAAEGDTETARRKLHALNYACVLDDPSMQGSFPDFAELNEMWNQASWFVPEGQLLAVDGERYVGLAAVGYFQESNSMYNLMTGVDRAYRGRQIAQALKVQSIRFAKAYGADSIRTHNDSQNGPMLTINRKLGYQPRPGEYRLMKRV